MARISDRKLPKVSEFFTLLVNVNVGLLVN